MRFSAAGTSTSVLGLKPMDGVRPLIVKLRRLLRSRGQSVDDTDDLIQEAFLRLQVYCRERAVNRPEAFLVRTALNLAVDRFRRG